MFLKNLSITELNFASSWTDGLTKIRAMSGFEKTMTIFWLLGPFIYLIERDPADFWLSFIGLVFLIRCIRKKDWSWTNQLWFKSSLILWLFGLFSAVTSPDPFFTFQQLLIILQQTVANHLNRLFILLSLLWNENRYSLAIFLNE